MKIIIKAIALISIAFAAEATATPVTLGSLVLDGNSCRLGDAGSIEVQILDGKLQIPAASTLRKAARVSLERGACSFALPIHVEPGYRLVLKDPSALGSVNVARDSRARIDLEIFVAGSQGQRMTVMVGSSQERIRQTIDIRQSETILVTSCSGQSLNLRGNSSTLLQGAALGRSTASLHFIEIIAEVEKCEQSTEI
jgi:hypothetical protein